MKNYEGKSTSFSYYEYGKLKYVFDRSIFSNRKLYPGDTWKKAHFILFGYYPKDWDDMLTYTSSKDIRRNDLSNPNKDISLSNFDGEFVWDDYDVAYESIKFIMEEEPNIIDTNIHSIFMGYHVLIESGDIILGTIYSNIKVIQHCIVENKFVNLELLTEGELVPGNIISSFDRLIAKIVYKKAMSQKNPVKEATNYLDINSLAQVTDENQRFIFSNFLEVIKKICKQSTKKDNSIWNKLQEMIKSEKVILKDFENKDPTPLFTLENTKVRLVFSNHNSVGIHFK